jgi:mRNA interferase RelE/StbE
MYNVDLSVNAQDFLNKLDAHIREQIENRLRHLKENQIPSDAKFIGRDEGEMLFRYRIGKYRALYKVKEKEKIVLVTKIDKRPKIYDNL